MGMGMELLETLPLHSLPFRLAETFYDFDLLTASVLGCDTSRKPCRLYDGMTL